MFNETIRRIQKRHAIRSYAQRLGLVLRQRYGASRYYTPEQVIATIEITDLSPTWIGYALCMYCEQSNFNQYYASLGKTCDYEAMQDEVAEQFSKHQASSRKGIATTVINSSIVNSAIINGAIGWSNSDGYGHSHGGFDNGCFGDGGFGDGGGCDAGE